MNNHDVGMATAEQDAAEGVLSCGAEVPRPIRIPGRIWHNNDGSTSPTASVRSRFGLEAAFRSACR